MPGIPKVKQCRSCKLWRVKVSIPVVALVPGSRDADMTSAKCDFNWPTCSPCKRMKQRCSGPPARFKFIMGQRTFYQDYEDQPSSSPQPQYPSIPKHPPATPIDLLASRPTTNFALFPHNDILLTFPYLSYLIQRLTHSAALCEEGTLVPGTS